MSHGFNKSHQKKGLYQRPGSLLVRTVPFHILNVTIIISEHEWIAPVNIMAPLKVSPEVSSNEMMSFAESQTVYSRDGGKHVKFRAVFVLS